MNQDNNAKYFKYVIGEIVLVVIGILIAFQLNTWKENRMKNKTQITPICYDTKWFF